MDGNERSQASDGQASRKPPPLVPGLHIVATPIGNMRDITLRALDVLREADLIACEDTRVFAKLASHYGIAAPTVAYSDATQDAAEPKIVRALAAGKRVALVSDAGMPLISDPGYRLVRAALAGDHVVTSAPGASAVPMALALSGLPTDRFFFGGFLPATVFAIVAATGNIYSGLWYPIVVAAMSFVVGLIFLPETKDRDITLM